MFSGGIGNLGREMDRSTLVGLSRQTQTDRERQRERASLLITSSSSEPRSHSTTYYGNHSDQDI
jgi:hypothetical protein